MATSTMKWHNPTADVYNAMCDIGNGTIRCHIERIPRQGYEADVKVTSKYMDNFVVLLSGDYDNVALAKKACERVIDRINVATYELLTEGKG